MENNNRQGYRWVKQDEEQARLKAESRMLPNWDRTHGDSVGIFYGYYIQELFKPESIEPCATSSRIEELEKCLKEFRPENIPSWIAYFDIWEKADKLLKSQTPSPTGDRDCEELKKEVERLKGLIEEAVKYGMMESGCGTTLTYDEAINEFKTTNNL